MSRADDQELKKVRVMTEWTRSRMREIREQRGWTQERLGREMNVATTRIGDFENGRFDLKITTLYRVMRALGVLPTEFYRGCPSWTDKA